MLVMTEEFKYPDGVEGNKEVCKDGYERSTEVSMYEVSTAKLKVDAVTGRSMVETESRQGGTKLIRVSHGGVISLWTDSGKQMVRKGC